MRILKKQQKSETKAIKTRLRKTRFACLNQNINQTDKKKKKQPKQPKPTRPNPNQPIQNQPILRQKKDA